MNPEIKKKWVAALLSGRYEQSFRRLAVFNEDGPYRFCALGVLCDIIAPRGWDPMTLTHEGARFIPSRSVLDRAGIDDAAADAVSSMNDGGASFRRLAVFIENKL